VFLIFDALLSYFFYFSSIYAVGENDFLVFSYIAGSRKINFFEWKFYLKGYTKIRLSK